MKSKRTLMYLAAGVAALAMIMAAFSYLFSSSPLGKGRDSKANLPSIYKADTEIKEAKAKVVLVTDYGTICNISKKSLLDNQKKVKKFEK